MNAILIYSGGMDSTVMLYKYAKEISLAVTFTHGARQDESQTECAKKNCKRLGINHMVIPLEFIGQYFKSSILKGGDDVPHGKYGAENMKSTVVPFRNGIMLAVAAGLAESNGLDTILIANHSGDHAVYPDCRPEFIKAMDAAVEAGTYAGLRVVSPFCNISKRDIALIGREIGVPFEDTYSCYEGSPIHCGECATCLERKEALAGFDPTDYMHL